MAARTDVIAADAVDHELEAMRKDDHSWHPCQVHFSPSSGSLVVKYGNNGSEDILVSEKEALTRIRVRSLPLQADDCTQIKPGDHVVVNRNSESETYFFDAEIEKVLPVRHSKRMNCRCAFMIRWLHQDLNGGRLKVPSSSVMRLAKESINNHPTISTFIDAVAAGNSRFSDMSPQLNVISDFDLDLHDLLEKQIEGIRNSVHGPKRIRDEILGLEDNPDEQIKEIKISRSREPESTRSNRSRKTLPKTDTKSPTPPVILSPPINEKLPENKSPLNPLAARAALASLMTSMLPKTIEISNGIDETSEVDNINISPETKTVIKPVKTTKSLFSENGSPDTSQVLEVSSTVNRSRKGNKKASEDQTSHVTGSRSTRAKVQNVDDLVLTAKRETVLKTEEEKTSSLSNNKRRGRRSVINKEAADTDTETETVKESGDHVSHLSGERKKKKRNTSGVSTVTHGSEGDMASKRGRGSKGSVDVKKGKVRCSPRLVSKT